MPMRMAGYDDFHSYRRAASEHVVPKTNIHVYTYGWHFKNKQHIIQKDVVSIFVPMFLHDHSFQITQGVRRSGTTFNWRCHLALQVSGLEALKG